MALQAYPVPVKAHVVAPFTGSFSTNGLQLLAVNTREAMVLNVLFHLAKFMYYTWIVPGEATNSGTFVNDHVLAGCISSDSVSHCSGYDVITACSIGSNLFGEQTAIYM